MRTEYRPDFILDNFHEMFSRAEFEQTFYNHLHYHVQDITQNVQVLLDNRNRIMATFTTRGDNFFVIFEQEF